MAMNEGSRANRICDGMFGTEASVIETNCILERNTMRVHRPSN